MECFISTSFENLEFVKENFPIKGRLLLENILTKIVKHFFISSCSICVDAFDQEMRDAHGILRQKSSSNS